MGSEDYNGGMKYCFALILLTWLQLGTTLPFSAKEARLASVEERLHKLETIVDRLTGVENDREEAEKTADEIRDYSSTDDDVTEQGGAVIGCGQVTETINKFLIATTKQFSKHFTGFKVTCGSSCSTLELMGPWGAEITLCRSKHGITVCCVRVSVCVHACMCVYVCIHLHRCYSNCICSSYIYSYMSERSKKDEMSCSQG